MTRLLQAFPAVLAACVLLALAVGLFVPREQLPAWFREQARAPGNNVPADTPDAAEPTAAALPAKTASRNRSPAAPGPVAAVSSWAPLKSRPESDAELMNCYFTPLPAHPSNSPRAIDVSLPEFPGRSAVWAGTGRDVQGRIWLGGCAEGDLQLSARLFCYDTQTGEMSDVGDVVSALREAGLLRDGERQAKIHSKIIQAGDGHLYFASMDEQGENQDGSQLPTWGGHLWRLKLPERKWEHLRATPEALIAVAGMGRYVYALGYFNHVLVQFDTETGAVATATVGSVDGHVSRNFLADLRGHAYVPRLVRDEGTGQVRSTLVEFDAALRQVGETELEFYATGNLTDSHGITGVQPLADGSLAFITHRGRLYRIFPAAEGAAQVKDLGWMHPLGEMAIESLFTCDGESWLFAAARLPTDEYEWVAFDLKSASSTIRPLDVPARYAGVRQGLLLYGSTARDVEGAYYLVGISMREEPFGPVIWRMMPHP